MRCVLVAAMMLGSCGAFAAPPCAGDVEIADAHIMRVEHNGVLVMTDGRALSLEGIRLPDAAKDRAPPEVADEAFAELNALAKGHVVEARAVYPKEDRYDRVRSQVFTPEGAWLQIELLKRGLARVDIAPDRGECYRELYDAENDARRQGVGVWAVPAYSIRTADGVNSDVGTFQIIQGVVLEATVNQGRAYLNFGRDWKTDFTVTISPDDMKTFRQMGVNPLGYKGKLVRVRGVVQWQYGPEIEIGNPKQVEVLQ